MGRIAPRRRKTTRIYQPLLRTWLNFSQRQKPTPASEKSEKSEEGNVQPPWQNGKGQKLRALLRKIWHLPDSFTWMAPLPYLHRRWVIIFGTILLLSLLWPYSDDNAQRAFPTASQGNNTLLQAQLQNDGQHQSVSQSESGDWRHYKIQAGQTLAQLFRDNNLPVHEVFAMAQAEGRDKPLSNLKAGQEVRIEYNANGVISALAVTTTDNREALFRRQADGSYLRIR